MFDKRTGDEGQHTTGLGVSLNDYIEQLEADLAPAIAEQVTLSGCARFEIVTRRAVEGQSYDPRDEVDQHLTITADGRVLFRANTYHHGPGRYGIGRVLETRIPKATVQEICRTLDTWLYTRAGKEWTSADHVGQWYLRVHFGDGREQVQRGSLEGAVVADIDISWFIRARVPVENLYLFDQTL